MSEEFDEEHPKWSEFLKTISTNDEFNEAMKLNGKVLICKDRKLIYVYEDGREEFVKDIA